MGHSPQPYVSPFGSNPSYGRMNPYLSMPYWRYNAFRPAPYYPYDAGYWSYDPSIFDYFTVGPGLVEMPAIVSPSSPIDAFRQNSDPVAERARVGDGFGELAVDQPQVQVREAGPVARERAQRYLELGDQHFRAGRFTEAQQRYRKASTIAPDSAAAQFRIGWSHLAAGRYGLAARAMRGGLAIDPAWAKSGFTLAELYGDRADEKDAHREALAQAIEAAPHDADLVFLLGVHLYFDGRADRAAPFLERAQQLLGGQMGWLAAFVRSLEKQAEPPKKNARADDNARADGVEL
jgi:tetratricopeptide (TPR) repeat protein